MKVSDRRRGSPVSVSRLVISRTHEGLRPSEGFPCIGQPSGDKSDT